MIKERNRIIKDEEYYGILFIGEDFKKTHVKLKFHSPSDNLLLDTWAFAEIMEVYTNKKLLKRFLSIGKLHKSFKDKHFLVEFGKDMIFESKEECLKHATLLELI